MRMTERTILRQGDILLVRVGDAEDAGESQPVTVGHGEATGHTHVVEAARTLSGDQLAWSLFARTGEWNGDGDPLLAVDAPTRITHQEHAALDVPAGVYRVVRQREYEPERERFVAD